MMTSVPSTPVSYSGGAMPLRILNKGPEYFRSSKRSGSGSENRRKTAAERLEADKFKYVKSEEVRQRRFTLELRTSSPPNNDSTGAQSMGTASTGSPTNMEEDDTMTGNDVIVDFSTEEIIQEMANFTRYKEIKNATPVLTKKQHRRPSSEHLIKSEAQADNSAEILHSMTASRRQQRMKNKALRNVEKNKSSSANMSDNVTPPSPLITRLRETLHGTGSAQANTGNASTPSPVAGATAEIGTQQEIIKMVTSKTDSVNKEIDTKHSYVSKSNSTGNSLNNYLNKAKEGIKNVASLRAIVGLEKDCTSREQSKERQSRSNAANNGRRYRSASAGPNVYKPLQNNNPRMESGDFSCNNHLSVAGSEPGSDANPMSPRSQLKHVRQNLKKVKIDTGRTYHRKHTNSETSVPSEYTSGLRKTGGSTFTVDPSLARKNRNVAKRDQPNMSNQVTSSEKGEKRVESKPPLMPRPRNDGIVNRQERPTENLKKRTKSTEGMDTEESASSNSRVNQVKRANSNRVKRRSWDILHSTENNMQSLSSKSSGEEDVPLTSGVTKSNNTQSTTRHRRPHSYSSEQRKSNLSSRMSLPEDAMQSFKDSNSHLLNKTGSRKSVAEALEEIINPILTNDELKNRNSAASPDIGSTGENTLVENRESFYGNLSTAATFGTGSITSRDATKNSSVADNINSALGGVIDEKVSDSETSEQLMTKKSKVPMKSKTVDSSPPYTRSRAMASRQLKEKESSSMELLDSSGQFVKSSNKPPSFFDGPNNSAHLRPVPMRQHSAPTGLANSHPISKVDWQTQSNSGTDDGQLTQSPKLAPKSRREVEPDHVRRRCQTHKPEDTMKSQQTSSSASGDASKPFTALTASDLKPRSNRNLRNVVPQSAPVKPTFAFPGQPVPQTRHNPKRHTTTPISPTLSPNKQAARMTPPQTPTRSCSSTPYSSLKRTPTSSRSSSLKRNRHRSKSDVLPHQHELDRFFSTMGMEDHKSMAHHSSINDTLYSNHLSSESDFSFAGASAYVRDSPDEAMDVDPTSRQLLRGPQSVSIIEKNARVMRWLMSCQKNRKQSTVTKPAPHTDSEFVASQSPPVSPTSAREPLKPSHQLLSTYPPQNGHHSGPSLPAPVMRQNSQPNSYSPPVNSYPSSPPPIPPRTYQRQQGIYAATHNDAAIVSTPKESNV